jgi:hypothetical protein
MLTTEQKQILKNRLDTLLHELNTRALDVKLIKDESVSIKDKPLGTALKLANEVLNVIDPSAEIENDVSKIVLNTIDFKNTRHEKWFQNNPRRINKKTALIHFDKSQYYESRFFWLNNNSTKSIVSAAAHLTPNWEDTIETKKATNLKIGIDFFLKPDSSGLLVVISNQGNLRVMELSEFVTNTQIEIFSSIHDIGHETSTEVMHSKLWDAFSVSSVNNSFYSGIAELFDELITFMSTSKDTENVKVFSMRLIGRILFIWFLKKKGFINDSSNEYFNTTKYKSSTEYYEIQLKKLFFHTLNTELSRRDTDKLTPYLNGGLFEAHDNDWYYETIKFPDDYFGRLYHHLRKYNFTTDESTNEYQQVAIDPEMLGRVFESLLATQITETGETARKAKGAFYTPREIVSFMCRESLRAYLYNTFILDNEKKAIDKLLDSSDFDAEQADTNFKRDLVTLGGDKFEEKLVGQLANVKILDPACGSGAFPMGMMHILVKTYERIIGRKIDLYKQKLSILKNNIFGIDIEPMAVEISRLRAWLSVIVDENDIKNVKPLPNLDFKFVCANSLVPMIQEITIDDFEVEETLHDIREKYFQETSHENKLALQKSYESIINEADKTNGLKVKQMKTFDPFKNRRAASFFNKFYMFGERTGFNIIIGNPPYIGESGHKAIFEVVKNTTFGRRFYLGKMDYFYFFVHLGVDLLVENGILSFITTNYYPTADGAKKLRTMMYNETDVLELINFNEITVFESARGQHDMITLLRKTKKPIGLTRQIYANTKTMLNGQELKDLLEGNSKFATCELQKRNELFSDRQIGEYNIRFKSPTIGIDDILNKIAKHNKLEALCDVNQGVIPNTLDIFVKPKGEFEHLGIPKSIIKPYFKNSDIFKWKTNNLNKKELLYIDNSVSIDQNTLKYLLPYKAFLENRREFREGRRPWVELHWAREKSIFESPKILIPYRCKTNNFAYNDLPWYASTDVYILTNKGNENNLFYLLGILNSKLMFTWLYNKGKRKGEILELFPTPLKQIPIPTKKTIQSEEIEYLVKQIANNDLSKEVQIQYENRLNHLVYNLYDLSHEEIVIINEFWELKQ